MIDLKITKLSIELIRIDEKISTMNSLNIVLVERITHLEFINSKLAEPWTSEIYIKFMEFGSEYFFVGKNLFNI